MFSVTTKTNYGLLAVLDLAEHYEKDLVQIKDIVKRRGVPRNYLIQILNRLTKHGIVKGVRGSNGGYVLGRDPGSITLLQVIESLEGKLMLKETSRVKVLKDIFYRLEEKIKESLSMSLSELIERQHELEQEFVFQI